MGYSHVAARLRVHSPAFFGERSRLRLATHIARPPNIELLSGLRARGCRGGACRRDHAGRRRADLFGWQGDD